MGGFKLEDSMKNSYRYLGFLAVLLLPLFVACSGTYYKAMESMGWEKRDLLVDRVEEARDAQEEASEQFTSALDQFRATVNFDGGDLETIYNRLNSEYEDSVAEAENVSERIDSVESVSEALFEEWQEELAEYSNADMRRDSESMLRDTKTRFKQMMAAMRRAEKSMDPVLEAFQDQVLYLKHNLNARAIGALSKELGGIERDTARLIADMQKAIAEADLFIRSMDR